MTIETVVVVQSVAIAGACILTAVNAYDTGKLARQINPPKPKPRRAKR